MGQVWVALGVQDLMGDQCQEVQGMGINTADSMEHLGKSTFELLENAQVLRSIKLCELLTWTTLTPRDPSRQRFLVLLIVYRYDYNYSQQQGGQYGNGPQGGWGGYNQQQGYPQQQSGDPSQGGKYKLVYHTIIIQKQETKASNYR